jgi:2-oxoglutarate ferredoxin oxidoreductase subunit beta
MQYLLLQLEYPNFPLPVGIFRKTEKPTFDDTLRSHEKIAKENAKIKTLKDLMYSGDIWTVK